MKELYIHEVSNIIGGSCPYCDGHDAGTRFRTWLGGIWDRMVEGSAITYNAMQSGI